MKRVLDALAWVAYPALTGAALLLCSLGVVTWLPAWAAAARTLYLWRTEDDTRCFTGVFRHLRLYLRPLAGHATAATVAGAVLLANMLFLSGRSGPVPAALLALQVGLFAAFAVFHLAVAGCAGADATGAPRAWRRGALDLAGRRGALLALSLVAAPVIALPVPAGPFLLGPTLPLLVVHRYIRSAADE